MTKSPTTPLYSKITKRENFFEKKKCYKNVKIAKQYHAYKGHASTYNVYVLNSFSPELHLKNTESAINKNVKKFIV